jgi:hypothetical protein
MPVFGLNTAHRQDDSQDDRFAFGLFSRALAVMNVVPLPVKPVETSGGLIYPCGLL